MGNRYPISTEYFCGNCEDEVYGDPVGFRIPSKRPLCHRCTEIGLEEGWAEELVYDSGRRVSFPSSRKPGIIILAFFVAVLCFVIWAGARTMVGWDRR
jgi:hypothetical protein